VPPGVETVIDLDGCPQPVVKPLPVPDARNLCAEGNCPNEGEALTKYIPNVKIDIKSTILFETGKATIKPQSKPILDEVAMQMLAHPEVKKIRVEGHTDSIGPEDDNLYLSQDRADSVRRYLISRGIAKERLVAVGYGLTRPIASNETVTGRAKNRRVEFVIVE
jgi:outer membrane protein OmpA-like peptidoglycan-associated protein